MELLHYDVYGNLAGREEELQSCLELQSDPSDSNDALLYMRAAVDQFGIYLGWLQPGGGKSIHGKRNGYTFAGEDRCVLV